MMPRGVQQAHRAGRGESGLAAHDGQVGVAIQARLVETNTTSPFTPSGTIQTGLRPMKDDLGVNHRQLRTFAELRGQPGLLSSG
jgi:hypothetical protein